MSSPTLFSESSPTLWSAWTLAPMRRIVHDPNRTNKITYTARLILVTAGKVLFRTEGSDLLTVPGTLLYIPPSCVYDSDFLTEEFTSRNLFFDFDADRVDRDRFTDAFTRIIPSAGTVDAALIRPFPGFADAPELSAPFTVRADAEMLGLTDRIMRETESPDPFARVLTRAWLTELLVLMLKKQRGERSPRFSEAYRRIAEYVEEHLSERLSGQEMAERLNYHPNYMNRVVSRSAGLSLHAFILRAKLRRAEVLLAATEIPIAEIAQSLGFCDAGHFTRVFSAREGITPRAFRNSSGQL